MSSTPHRQPPPAAPSTPPANISDPMVDDPQQEEEQIPAPPHLDPSDAILLHDIESRLTSFLTATNHDYQRAGECLVNSYVGIPDMIRIALSWSHTINPSSSSQSPEQAASALLRKATLAAVHDLEDRFIPQIEDRLAKSDFNIPEIAAVARSSYWNSAISKMVARHPTSALRNALEREKRLAAADIDKSALRDPVAFCDEFVAMIIQAMSAQVVQLPAGVDGGAGGGESVEEGYDGVTGGTMAGVLWEGGGGDRVMDAHERAVHRIAVLATCDECTTKAALYILARLSREAVSVRSRGFYKRLSQRIRRMAVQTITDMRGGGKGGGRKGRREGRIGERGVGGSGIGGGGDGGGGEGEGGIGDDDDGGGIGADSMEVDSGDATAAAAEAVEAELMQALKRAEMRADAEAYVARLAIGADGSAAGSCVRGTLVDALLTVAMSRADGAHLSSTQVRDGRSVIAAAARMLTAVFGTLLVGAVQTGGGEGGPALSDRRDVPDSVKLDPVTFTEKGVLIRAVCQEEVISNLFGAAFSVFRRLRRGTGRGVLSPEKRKCVCLLLSFGAVFVGWEDGQVEGILKRGGGEVRALCDQVGKAFAKVDGLVATCETLRPGSAAYLLKKEAKARIGAACKDGFLARGIVTWARECLWGGENARDLFNTAEIHLNVLKLVAVYHSVLRRDVVNAVRDALVRRYVELEDTEVAELHRMHVRCLVELVRVGVGEYVAVVLRRDVAKRGRVDVSLVRFFVKEVLKMVRPPYGEGFVRAMLALLEVPLVVRVPAKEGRDADEVTRLIRSFRQNADSMGIALPSTNPISV